MFLLAFLAYGCLWAHPLKLSTCWIVQDKNEISVTFNFFADDFGDALKTIYGDFINLEEFDPKTKKKMVKYIEQNFTFKINEKKYGIQVVEHSLKQNIFRLHFRMDKKIKYDNGSDSISITNTLLLKEIEKQTNIVRIDLKGDGNFKSLEFKKGKEIRKFTL